MDTTPAPASPTGQPVIPPRFLPYLIAAYFSLLGVEGVLLQALGADHLAVLVGGGILAALAPLLGIASPGLRRVVVALLLVGTVTSASGCAWWRGQHELQADLSACATGVVVGEVEALMGEAAQALQSSPVDWDRHLDQLVARGGQAALCAILALADALSGGTGGSQTDPLGDYDRALRAAYLRTYARGVAVVH